ncbi:histidine kinase [Acetatifactor muris]|uniref:Sensor histidine kinase YpdA n=1 Tax=Acetatifactor muris TaxID=879566 RepID=A0A2K4ZNL0_9FIRM|nr:histidine kinase [Acetatifactor muris]MCI8798340.1 histidine kinase [Lachnospiraceae bacterium]MCR2050443.1 histidine kinase [Acetatifactor muris]SOY32069.1 Sensor histidine kinase YpdA [Acetatifactor muris]
MRKWFWNLNLKKKFSLLIFMMIIVTMTLETLNRRAAYDTYNQLLYEDNARVLMLYMDYVENVFARMENITYLMIADTNLQENLMYLRDHYGEEEWISRKAAVSGKVSSYAYRERYFSAFLLKTESLIFGFGGSGLGMQDDLSPFIEKAADANGQMRLISGEEQLILVREIRQAAKLELSNLGYIVAQVNFNGILNDMGRTFRHADMPIDISVYDGGVCLYASRPDLTFAGETEKGWYIDGDEFITAYTSETLGFTMVIRTPYEGIEKTIQGVYRRSLLLSLLIALLALTFGSTWVKIVIRDIYGLIDKMDAFGAGKPLNPQEEKQYQHRLDEVGKMYRHFYRMASDYKRLMEEYYDNQLLLKEAEFSRMQKQIQPHFLFNTLTAITWMAYSNQDTETANMAETLGRMMRMVTDSKQVLTSVESDLQMAEDYLFIQQIRFQNRLQVRIEISPETKALLIPRISIQPLVENSVTYAMEERISCCEIRIFDRMEQNSTEIVVEDNGPGFAEDILQRLESGEQEARGTGTALQNIQKRLQYTFSAEYGLSFHRLEEGMQVIIRLPNDWEEAGRNAYGGEDKAVAGG